MLSLSTWSGLAVEILCFVAHFMFLFSYICTFFSFEMYSAMHWRHGSSGRAPALQVQSPEFRTPVPPPPKEETYFAVRLFIYLRW
jgi:hypothetical protein